MELQRLADLSIDALIATENGIVVYANAAAHRLFAPGADRQALPGLPVKALWHPDALPEPHSADVGAPLRVHGRSLDGRKLHLEISTERIGAAQWAIRVNEIPAIASGTELAALRATMAAERARAQLFRAGLDEVSDALSLVDPVTMQYVDFNDAACRLRGATREEMMAAGPAAAMGMPAEELRAKYGELIARHPETVVDEQEFTRADGAVGMLESTRRALKVDGRWLIVVVARDITQRKRSQSRIELLASAVNLSSDVILLIDRAEMRLLEANDAACGFYGITRDELLTRRPWELHWVNADRNSLEALFDDVIAASPRQVMDTSCVVQQNGVQRAVEIQRHAIQIEERWIIVLTLRDISEGKRSQARLERFASALDLSADALFLIDRETLTYLDFNESACRLMGVRRAELMARSPSHACITLHTQEKLGELYDRVISQAPDVLADELSVTRADGSKVSCEVHRQALLSEGRWVILANVRDITERKEQQARLQRFASVVNMSADAVFLIEREGMRILDVNDAACRLYRYERAELLNLPLRRTMRQGPHDVDIEQQYDDLIALSPRISRADRVQVRSDGTSFPAESQSQAILSGGKWIIAITVRDVTEQHRAAEELSKRVSELTRSNEELAQYAYVISHDLSEPLRAMSSYTQLLERRYASQLDEDAREFMGYIVGGAHRMKRLIDDLLSYAQAGRSDVPIRPAPLETALNDALANLSSAIERAGATVEVGKLPDISCDKSMAQVFQNLIGNALKFRGEPAPRIRVDGVDEGDAWVVSVQDNGIGIEPEFFTRIFVLFQRLHPRVKYEGTGIGLSICKKIVERHGGQICVESVPGQGACFNIRLPKAAHACKVE